LKLSLAILFFLFFFESYSQSVSTLGNDDAEINRLKKEINTSSSDSVKSINHLKISGLYFKNDALENYTYHLQKGEFYSRNYPFLKVYVEYNKSLELLNNGEYDLFYKKISEILSKLKKFNNASSINLQLMIIQNISIYHTLNLNYDLSIDILLIEGIPLAKKTKNYTALGTLYESIADSFYELDYFSKSSAYYKLAIENYKKEYRKSKDLLGICYIYYANCLVKLVQHKEANSILNTVHALLIEHQDNNLYPLYYNAVGELQLSQKKYPNAITSFKKGLALIKENSREGLASETYLSLSLNLAKSLYEVKEYQFSIELLNQLHLDSRDQNQLFAYDLYYRNFKKIGNFAQSSQYLTNYIELKDRLRDSTKDREYRNLEARYHISEKEKKIAALHKDKIDREARLKNLNLKYGLASISLFIFLVFFYFLFKNFKNQKKMNEQQAIINKQNLDFLSSLKDVEVMQAMIEGEESERKRISRDLHDGIGSRLSSLKMQLDYLNLPSGTNEDYEKFSSNLNLIINDLRKTAFNLVPETLSKLGLDLALKDLCFVMSNTLVKIHYSSTEISPKILSSQQVTIFRIVQELINNALKHANCTEIIIDCSQNKELFLITVEDNGIGFIVTDFNSFTGLGLKSIKNRVELLNGNFEIKSIVSKGTVFNIELQVKLNVEN
jgi:two-component system, NarL family, sensor kinase